MPGSDPGYRLSPLARTDLEDIWRYTFENWSLEQADRYHGAIMTAIGALADGSISGSRTDVREDSSTVVKLGRSQLEKQSRVSQ